jgi:glutathione S-transferase
MVSSKPVLVVGDLHKSSWSMRPFVGLIEKGVDFDLEVVALDRPESRKELAAASPSGLVPVLRDGNTVVCESLAILEYTEERFPGPALLPPEMGLRAEARMLAARMHAGWAALREGMSFEDSFLRPPPPVPPTAATEAGQILELWERHLERHEHDGPFLVGSFGLADCMFAPVCQRFAGFQQDLSGFPRATAYQAAVLARPSVRQWLDPARIAVP